MNRYRILAINPGSTSTKVAVFEGRKPITELTLRHSSEDLKGFSGIIDQFEFRKNIILGAVRESGIDIASLDAMIGRGGVVKPIPSGVYEVNDALKRDLFNTTYGEHASNLGGLIAAEIAESIGVKAYIADPVVVDELQDVARQTGIPSIERLSIFHALNQKAISRLFAEKAGKKYEEINLIVAHMGGGISIGAHRKGKVVDVNNCLDGEGPIAPERAGTIPAWQFAKLCMSGRYSETEVKKMLTGQGGLVAHLGTNSAQEMIRRAEEGDKKAELMMDAMCYTVGKSIGAMAAALQGSVDGIILTGGIAYNAYVCERIEKMVSFIAPVTVMPGENELEALAMNALRVLEGTETPKVYE